METVKPLTKKQKKIIVASFVGQTFLQFVAEYGYECNKSFGFKEIASNNRVSFVSYQNTFLGYVMLDVKFVLFIPKNKTLVPVFSVPHPDSVGRKIRPHMVLA